MNYHAYELAHGFLSPWRLGVEALQAGLDHPLNPLSVTPLARSLSAACELFEKVTRRYGKPALAIHETAVDGIPVTVQQVPAAIKPFCTLRRFQRDETRTGPLHHQPAVLVIAPMSGHYATLMRDVVAALIGDHDVYITDWTDARDVPLIAGAFDLDDFIDYTLEFLRLIGPETHVIAASQSSVPALAATALLAAANDLCEPASLTLLGGPVDARQSPSSVNRLIESRPLSWFAHNVLSTVPFLHAGAMRRVYPGFTQLTGFMTMDLERHLNAHVGLFNDLVRGDRDSVRQHQEFYEEYLAVMDLTAEFFLDTVARVFQRHELARGEMRHRSDAVDCARIRRTALMTVEAEHDVVCGHGQTHAALDLCTGLAPFMKQRLDQPGTGHFGLFHGTRWRTEIAPRVRRFIHNAGLQRRTGQSRRHESPDDGAPALS